MTATVSSNLIPVSRLNGEFLVVDIPNGWDDVKRIKSKILTLDGKHYVFRGWNSDRNECFFFETKVVATIS